MSDNSESHRSSSYANAAVDTSCTTGTVVDSSSMITTASAASWKSKKKIVEELVQRVVPEEIQNVDEMLNQFRGREDELIDTLRTMQELYRTRNTTHRGCDGEDSE